MFQTSGFPHTHVSIDAEIEDALIIMPSVGSK